MDPVEELVHAIMRYYVGIGGFCDVPHDLLICDDLLDEGSLVLIHPRPILPPSGTYNHSLTVNEQVVSSTTGRLLTNRAVGPKIPVYWIRRSDGYENARIIAHCYALASESPFGVVGSLR